MSDLFKKNWKKVTGVRVDELPLSIEELARLKDIVGSGNFSVSVSGDLSGTTSNAIVDGIQGNPVASGVPSSGDVLTWTGSEWAPSTSSISPLASEFRVDIPGGASLAAKIAGATLPSGWTIVLGNDGSVDTEIVSVATDIALIHNEGAFAVSISICELDGGAAPLGGYYMINTSAVPSLSKSNKLGTQFTVLGFTGLITLARSQRLFIKMLSVP